MQSPAARSHFESITCFRNQWLSQSHSPLGFAIERWLKYLKCSVFVSFERRKICWKPIWEAPPGHFIDFSLVLCSHKESKIERVFIERFFWFQTQKPQLSMECVKYPNTIFQPNNISFILFYVNAFSENRKKASTNIIASHNRDNNILFISLYFRSDIELLKKTKSERSDFIPRLRLIFIGVAA